MLFAHARPIDLTLTIDERYPTTWPPHVPFVRRTWNWFSEERHGPETWTSACGPYYTEVLIIDEHIATHFDAPSHFVPDHAPGKPGAICGEQIPLSQFAGNAVVVDVSDLIGDKPGVSPFIEQERVLAAEQQLGRALTGDDVVLFRSDWDERFYHPFPRGNGYAVDVAVLQKAPGWPAPSVACIDLLLQRGVRCVGTDGPSMGAAHDGAPAHVTGLGRGMVFIEGLANLREIPDATATFQFLPIKIAQSSGGPGRAVAWIPVTDD
jgi:kynurenine formamidase